MKKATIVLIILAVLGVSVAAVGAQGSRGGEPGSRPFGQMEGRFGEGRFRDGPMFDLLSNLANGITEQTGLTLMDIREAVREGATLAEVIEANGGDTEVVVDTVVTSVTDAVNAAVEEGQIDAERAEAFLSDLEENVRARLEGETPIMGGLRDRFEGRFGDRFGDRPGHQRSLANAVAEATGLERSAIVEQVQAGSSLADILTENGQSVDEFVEAQVASTAERLAPAVEEGRMSQEVYDARLALLRVQLNDWLNRTLPEAEADTAS